MSRLKPGASVGPFPYRIVKPLGAGSGNMSDVYLATVGPVDAHGTASHVVIKISKSQDEHKEFFEDTIFNEAERLRQLDHRGIVRILPIQTDHRLRAQAYSARANGLPGDPWFLVLEHLTGDSLADLFESYRQLDVALTLEIIRKLAQTLEYLHFNDLVHLDIKPENILFRRPLEPGSRVEPVLIDFGIARNTGQAGLEGRTLHYAPPERILTNRGNAPPETLPRPAPSMDIYSLGVVFYQMLAGRRPFEGRNVRNISSAILEGKPTRPSHYRNLQMPKLDQVIMQMLHRDPNQRPTAGELVQQLASLRAQPAYQPTAPTTSGTTLIGVRRRRGLLTRISTIAIWLVALLGVILLGSGLWAYFQTNQSSASAQGESAPSSFQSYLPDFAALPQLLVGWADPTGGPTNEPAAPASDESAAADPITVTVALTPTALATPTPAATATATATSEPPTAKPPTSTPVPELPTNTVAPPTATTQPTVTQTRRPTSTPAPENTIAPTATPTQRSEEPSTKPASTVRRAVTLLSPADGTEGDGKATFSWQANFRLLPGQAYEFIIWRTGQDPLRDGLGWAGTTTATSITTDLIKQGAVPEAYEWGVRLVETQPKYKKLEFLGGGWRYLLKSN